ncbi:MAG TPA: response regulator transcription factor [Polyangiaceae bacterium]|nr:response regulator transcription factor [Polyangiaceae bacterium]
MGRHRQSLGAPYVPALDAPLRPSAVVVARDPLARSGLAAVLSAYPGLILAEARVSVDGEPSADVIVWDAPEAEARVPGAPVLALVEGASEARQALRSGARGALSRSTSTPSIAPAALAVAAGHFVLDAAFVRALVELEGPLPTAASPISPREHEVLELVAEGLSNRDIAARLGISRHTAKFHVNAILDKLGAATRTEAVVLAARSGLLSL